MLICWNGNAAFLSFFLFLQTFCSDAQVADSACSATAYLCGVKANSGTIGLTPDVAKNNCSAQNEAAYRLSSILAWAQVIMSMLYYNSLSIVFNCALSG